MKWDAKTIAALAGLIATITGAVELRVQVGLMAQKVDSIESRVAHIEREVQTYAANP